MLAPALAALALALLASPKTGPDATCRSPEATAAYKAGFEAQAELKTDDALAAWKKCLAIEPDCVPCLYESGWTRWSRSEWTENVKAWERVLVLDSSHSDARAWLQQARENGERDARGGIGMSVPIGTASTAGLVGFELVARFQNYDSHPESERDRYDADIHSPKSVRVSADGTKAWVNSLQGGKTVVYDAASFAKRRVIHHRFEAKHAPLFAGAGAAAKSFGWKWQTKVAHPDRFRGLPVESELTHGGKYLWIPYYRRDFDRYGTSPSALAVIDAATDAIVRVMPAGPIPKYVTASPSGKWLAVVHWGDNSAGLIDVSSGDPAKFTWRRTLVVEKQLPLARLGAVNRDKQCGFCLRGSVFTADSKTLLVARMGGGGIAGFDVATGKYLGTVLGMKPTPRHLALSADGATLYLSSNVSGYVSKIDVTRVTGALAKANGAKLEIEGWTEVYVGGGARTLAVSPDGRFLFVAVQSSAELVAVDAATFALAGRVRADAFPVGLAISPDGKTIWVTSQGRSGRGGNSVCVFRVADIAGGKPLPAPSPPATLDKSAADED